MRSFSIIVAADLASGIGLRGGLPWRLRKDMAFFAKITSKVPLSQPNLNKGQGGLQGQTVNACIMGRRTWESIPQKFRPLPHRLNVIVSRNPHYLDDKPEKDNPMVALASSLEAALEMVASRCRTPESPAKNGVLDVERIFLIGGSQLYQEGIRSKDCTHIFMTRIQATVECDAFFPEIDPQQYTLLPSDQGHAFLEEYVQEPVQGGMIEEGEFQYEYTVYNRL